MKWQRQYSKVSGQYWRAQVHNNVFYVLKRKQMGNIRYLEVEEKTESGWRKHAPKFYTVKGVKDYLLDQRYKYKD